MDRTQRASSAGNLRASLDQLERLLLDAVDPLPELGGLGDPTRLEFLFRLELTAIARAGPGAEISPERLLLVAQRAAAAGILTLATPPTLRRTLRRLEARLHEADAWDPRRPLWWSPLPALSATEELWRQAGRFEETVPAERLARAFGDPSRRWLSLPSLVPASLIRAVHDQLETGHASGALDLERAGVGAEDRLSAQRNDSVRYVSGLEPELVEKAPAMAALVQWCLARLGQRLAGALDRVGALFAPCKAMLARYPAISGGYHPHLDNPGGAHDNGRTLTFVLYLKEIGRAHV